MSKNYLIVFESPFYFDLKWSLVGYSMDTVIRQDPKKTTKIHLVRLDTGEVTTMDSGIWSVVLHFGNAYE